MKIRIILDNEAKEGLHSEHSLSLLVEISDKKILFDTGQSNLFLENFKILGLDIKEITHIFLSHNHYDHTGGLAYLDLDVPIYAAKGIFEKCYSKHDDGIFYDISMPEKSVNILKSSKFIEINSFEEILDGVYSTAMISRDFPTYSPKVFYKDECGNEVNDILDEQSMLLSEGVLITGCCHSGLVNTVEFCKKNRPEIPLKVIIGGLHLLHSSESELRAVSDYINTLNLEKIILLHCTGDNAKKYFSENLNCQVVLAKAGDVIDFVHEESF